MPKKIQVYFRDEFEPGEFARLSASVIQALRGEFPEFIVHTDALPKYRERFIVYVYGLWGADGDAVDVATESASKTVERLLSNIGWRNASQPAARPEVPESEEALPTTTEDEQE